MLINVIHNSARKDRFSLLQKEIQQEQLEVMYWPAVLHKNPRTGISRAHKQIVRDAKLRNLPEVCIAEDDIHFTCAGAWKYFLGNMPEDFDIYLASVYWGEIKACSSVVQFSGMTLYIVRQRFYETFLSIDESKHIDMELKNKGRYIVCNPFAAIQHETISANTNKKLNNERWLRKRKFFGGYDENGQTKTNTYEQLKILSIQRPESIQANS